MIHYILENEGGTKTLRDEDVLALQDIMHHCNDQHLKTEVISNHAGECLAGCHGAKR